MYIERTQPRVDMKAPIAKKIKDVIGRAAGKTGILRRDFGSKMVIVTFHRINDTLPEGDLTPLGDGQNAHGLHS